MKRSAMVLALLSLIGVTTLTLSAEVQGQSADQVAKKPPRNLAILIFEGVQIIDYTGPYETFGHVYSADQPVPFNTYTVAEKGEALTTAMGMSVNPKYTIDNAPKPDVIVVPGGDVRATMNDAKVIKWLQDSSKDAEIVMSVCNGAFILAKAGLLDGLEATTTATLIERFKEAAPKTRVVSDKRFVDNGKIITTAGLSSGIDGSLHIIERLYGRGTAQMAALGMEYNWDPESKYARAALADKYLPNQYDIESVTKSWVPVDRSGGVDRWESKWSITSEASPTNILEHVEPSFSNNNYFPRARNIKWVKQSEEKSTERAKSLWKLTDEQGNLWNGVISIEPVTGGKNKFVVSVKIDRINKQSRADYVKKNATGKIPITTGGDRTERSGVQGA
jgi:putative intracellular protease/amidase